MSNMWCKDQSSVMENKWRMPTIMELSGLFQTRQFDNYVFIWTCTPFKTVFEGPHVAIPYYWSGVLPAGKDPIYKGVSDNQRLANILVKSHGDYLNWVNHPFRCTFLKTQELCDTLNQMGSDDIKYTTKRASCEE